MTIQESPSSRFTRIHRKEGTTGTPPGGSHPAQIFEGASFTPDDQSMSQDSAGAERQELPRYNDNGQKAA